MISMNKRSLAIFERLVEGLDGVGESRVIDNTEGAFMPVHVEVIGRPAWENLRQHVRVVSVAHYFEQHGDLCKDPDMTFLVGVGAVYPMTFEQSIPPVYQVAAEFRDDGKLYVAEKLQRKLTAFANEWLSNIAEQQF